MVLCIAGGSSMSGPELMQALRAARVVPVVRTSTAAHASVRLPNTAKGRRGSRAKSMGPAKAVTALPSRLSPLARVFILQ
jgi:hypothetical protein